MYEHVPDQQFIEVELKRTDKHVGRRWVGPCVDREPEPILCLMISVVSAQSLAYMHT